MTEKHYKIWSIEHDAWWAPACCGYLKSRAEAGIYSEGEALDIVRNANIGLHDVPNEAMVQVLIPDEVPF